MSTKETLKLGEFLRAKRASLRAPVNGMTRRRTPGLRREEVAELAGMSTDWYSRLEQNRANAASPEALDRLSRALVLSRDERKYLFRLAGRETTVPLPPPSRPHPSALAALRQMTKIPAGILGTRMDVLAGNELYFKLFLNFGSSRRFKHNAVWFLCCDPRAVSLFADHRTVTAEAVAALRWGYSHHRQDANFQKLIHELSRCSKLFRTSWAEQHVIERKFGRKRFCHPRAGSLAFNWHCLFVSAAPAQLLVFFEPADAATAAALPRLLSEE